MAQAQQVQPGTIKSIGDNGFAVTGGGVSIFRAATIASAMRLYIKTGMKANRAYTPTNMLAAAGQILGKTYKRGQLQQAADDLDAWVKEQREKLHGAPEQQ